MSLLILPMPGPSEAEEGTGTVWVLFSDRGMCVSASPAALLHRERKGLGLWVQTLETLPRARLLGLCPGSGDLGWAEHSTRLGGVAAILGGVFFFASKSDFFSQNETFCLDCRQVGLQPGFLSAFRNHKTPPAAFRHLAADSQKRLRCFSTRAWKPVGEKRRRKRCFI